MYARPPFTRYWRLIACMALALRPVSTCAAAAPDDAANPRWRFVDVAAAAGLDFVQRSGTKAQKYIVDVKSTGVAVIDADGDGLQDLFLVAGSDRARMLAQKPGFGCRLYRNIGGLHFVDQTEAAGLPSDFGWACGAAVADVDDDGHEDLLVTCIGRDRLFLNRGGHFEEATDTGFATRGWSTSAAFGDLDGDGDLDLFVAAYIDFDFENPPEHGKGHSCLWKQHIVMCGPRGLQPSQDHVYENLGGGRFRDVTEAWAFTSVPTQYGLGVVITDFDGDGRNDVFVANDSSPNQLFVARKPGEDGRPQFEEIGFTAGISVSMDGQEQAGMGIAIADLDDNGKTDVFVTNFESERNNLYLNAGGGLFFDDADRWHLGPPGQRELSWGTGFFDFDGDGLLDLFVANGHVYPQAADEPSSGGYAQRDHLFVGQPRSAARHFVERGEALGLATPRVSRGATFGDFDGDGDVDIVVSHLNDQPALYENRSKAGARRLVLTLAQEPPNREAIGAHVRVTLGDFGRNYVVIRNASFQSSQDVRLFVGLGSRKGKPAVDVVWPNGIREHFDIDADARSATIVRGRGHAK